MSTSSRACRPPSRSTRRAPPATRAPPWAPSPRSTTTCACSSPASAWSTAPRAARRSPGRPPSRSLTGSWSCPRAPGSRCWPPWCGAARARTRRCWRTCRHRASPGRVSTASSTRRPSASSWRAMSSTPSRSSSTAWYGARASPGASPSPWRRRSSSPMGWPRSRSCPAPVVPPPRASHPPAGMPRWRVRRSRSRSTWPAPTGMARSRSWRPATSRSTRPTALVRRATGLAPASRSTPRWWCPTPASAWRTAPSRPGRAGTSATSSG